MTKEITTQQIRESKNLVFFEDAVGDCISTLNSQVQLTSTVEVRNEIENVTGFRIHPSRLTALRAKPKLWNVPTIKAVYKTFKEIDVLVVI